MPLMLVTGAGGFLGGHVCRLAAARGWQVRGLDLAHPENAPYEAITGSITRPETVAAAMDGAAAVVHAAALTALWYPDRRAYFRVNAGGTRVVAAAALAQGARMVHVSSYTTLVAGDPVGALLDEAAELHPRATLGPYPASKREAERAVLAEVARGLRASIVLPSAPVGPGDRTPTAPMRLIRDLARGRLPALFETHMNFVDVEAVALGCLQALERGEAGRRYLLSGEDALLSHVAAEVARLAGVRAPSARVPAWLAMGAAYGSEMAAFFLSRDAGAPITGVRLAIASPRFSNARARAELGFDPPPLAATLARAVAAVQA